MPPITPALLPDDPVAEPANTVALTAALRQSAATGAPVRLGTGTYFARPGGGPELAGASLVGNGSANTILATAGPAPLSFTAPFQSYREQCRPAKAADRQLWPAAGVEFPLAAGAFRPGDSLFLRLGVPLGDGTGNAARCRRWRFTVARHPGDGSLILDRPLGIDWPDLAINPGKRVSGGVPIRGYNSPQGGIKPNEQTIVYPANAPALQVGQAVYVTDGQGCWDELRGEFARVFRMLRCPQPSAGWCVDLDRPLRWGYDSGLAVLIPAPHLNRLTFADLTLAPPVVNGRAPAGYFKFCLDLRFERVAFPVADQAGGAAVASSSGVRFWDCSGPAGHGLGAANDVRFDLCGGWGVILEEFCRDVTVAGCDFTGDVGVQTAGPSPFVRIESSRVAGGFSPFDDSAVVNSRVGGPGVACWWHGDRGLVQNSTLDVDMLWQGQAGQVGGVAVRSFGSMASPFTGRQSTGTARGLRRLDGQPQPAVAGWAVGP